MIFAFNLMNHSKIGQRSLEDPAGIIGHQLMALGHKAIWDDKNDRFVLKEAGYNLLFEGFTDESVKVIADGYAQGARFIAIATEEPTDKGFNHGVSKEMAMRQETFVKAAPYLSGILHLVPGERITRWFSQFAPTSYAELGYAPTLVRGHDFIPPKYDFGFFGSLSPRRLRILKKLARTIGTPDAVRVIADFPTQAARDKAIREAKVVVQLRKFDQMGLVSSSRCNTALCCGRPVVAEPHDLCKPWDEVIKFSETEESFYMTALAVRAAWKGTHEAQMARFKEKFSPEASIGRPLREIGILEGREAA